MRFSPIGRGAQAHFLVPCSHHLYVYMLYAKTLHIFMQQIKRKLLIFTTCLELNMWSWCSTHKRCFYSDSYLNYTDNYRTVKLYWHWNYAQLNYTYWSSVVNNYLNHSCPWIHYMRPNPIPSTGWPNPTQFKYKNLNPTQPNATHIDCLHFVQFPETQGTMLL